MSYSISALPFLAALAGLIVATLVIVRDARARAHQFLAAGLAALALHQVALAAVTLAPSGRWFFAGMRVTIALAALVPPLWLAFSLTLAERAGGVFPLHWRPASFILLITTLGASGALTAAHPVFAGGIEAYPPALVSVDAWGRAFFGTFVVGLTVMLLHMENVYRHSDRITRWRIKFLLVGTFVAFSAQIIVASYILLHGVFHPWHAALSSVAFLVGATLTAVSLVRSRVLRADVFFSRYVVYRSLALALVGVYLVSLGATAKMLQWLDVRLDLVTGILLGSVGAAGLALVFFSENFRGRTLRFLHTHCYRHKYDFRLEWMEFTRRLSQTTAIQDIAASTVKQILEVMWVRRVALYATTATPGRMTIAYQVEYDDLPATLDIPPTDLERLRAAARHLADPATPDFVFPTPPTVASAFADRPVGMVVPLAALNTLVGFLVVGPEQSGEPFGVDDRDLLAAVAAQAGAVIVNAMLAQEAAEGREFQALARLSAFVAHDLKNSVSMLSMLAENASQHLHKPAFQADAVRTLGEVTAKMRKVLARLAAPGDCAGGAACRLSLRDAAPGWLQDLAMQAPPRVRFETAWAGTLDVNGDPDQLRSVLSNLVLNAIEAMPGEGHIRVETADDQDCAVLRVADSGAGMSQEFLRERLFRPFQTTKPRGLGIGLYQSRQIIQAHNGSLTVESREGHGTQITIRLPAASVARSAPPGLSRASDAPPGDDPSGASVRHPALDLAFIRR